MGLNSVIHPLIFIISIEIDILTTHLFSKKMYERNGTDKLILQKKIKKKGRMHCIHN